MHSPSISPDDARNVMNPPLRVEVIHGMTAIRFIVKTIIINTSISLTMESGRRRNNKPEILDKSSLGALLIERLMQP